MDLLHRNDTGAPPVSDATALSPATARFPTPIGFIGVGELAAALVEGLCSLSGPEFGVLLSPRGAATAARLADQYPNVTVCPDNQSVAADAEVLLLTVRPGALDEACSSLRPRAGATVVSAVAGASHAHVRRLLSPTRPGPTADIVRVIPLPSVRRGGSVTVTYPAHPVVEQIFERLGGTLHVDDDRTFNALASATGTCSTLLGLVSAIALWLSRQGVEARTAEGYVRQMVHGLTAPLRDARLSISALVEAHETPGGLNEQLRTSWLAETNVTALHRELDRLNRRVAGAPAALGVRSGA